MLYLFLLQDMKRRFERNKWCVR